jgi:hypothetical protein
VGLVSGKRGQPSNRRLPDELRSQAIDIVRDRYADFGPTLVCEKLFELHDLRASNDTQTLSLLERLEEIEKNPKATIVIQHDLRDIGKLPAFPAAEK